ncbi:MAG: CsgG/HfaB family protein [Halioglobus sp.]|nr:CsgG/HfaB family protein [Halioglobus sp.]
MIKKLFLGVLSVSLLGLAGCEGTAPVLGGGSKGNAVTGGAAGGNSAGQNSGLESCSEPLGTMGVYEDRSKSWWDSYSRRYPELGSTIPVIRTMIQQSNCFVIVERGVAMDSMNTERDLARSGETRSGSNFGKGQVVAADYTMSPSIQFSEKGTGGMGGLVGGMLGSVGAAVAGGLKSNDASTTLLLIDNRSSVQIASSVGSARNYDFSLFGGMFRGAGAGAGGFTDTPEGKIIAAAFADSFNKMVIALRNYEAQNVKGGLGKGGQLKVGD